VGIIKVKVGEENRREEKRREERVKFSHEVDQVCGCLVMCKSIGSEEMKREARQGKG